jgi:hypothetical protein
MPQNMLAFTPRVGTETLIIGTSPPLWVLLSFGVVLLAGWLLLSHAKHSRVGRKAPSSSSEREDQSKTATSGEHGEGGRIVIFNADPSFPKGVEYASSQSTSCAIETDVARSRYLLLHKPTDCPGLMKSGKYPYGGHFHTRKRNWEIRIQFTLKRDIKGAEVYIGLAMDEYPNLSWLADKAGLLMIQSFQRFASGLYFSRGDDPKKVKGEHERRQIVFPLWIMDQLIITEEGDTPPDLCDPGFPTKGIIKADDRGAFSKAMQDLKLTPGTTYTFGLWAPAQLVDVIRWQTHGKDLRSVGVSPPCFLTMYALKPNPPGSTETRHLDSRKDHIINCATWSSLVLPDARRAQELSARRSSLEKGLPEHERKSRGRTCAYYCW